MLLQVRLPVKPLSLLAGKLVRLFAREPVTCDAYYLTSCDLACQLGLWSLSGALPCMGCLAFQSLGEPVAVLGCRVTPRYRIFLGIASDELKVFRIL